MEGDTPDERPLVHSRLLFEGAEPLGKRQIGHIADPPADPIAKGKDRLSPQVSILIERMAQGKALVRRRTRGVRISCALLAWRVQAGQRERRRNAQAISRQPRSFYPFEESGSRLYASGRLTNQTAMRKAGRNSCSSYLVH